MRNFLKVILPIFIMISVIAICIGIYLIFTNKLPNVQNFLSNTDIPKNQNISNNDIVLSSNELPKIDASVKLQPLVTAVAKNFTQDINFSDSVLNYSNEEEGFKKLINGQIDILFANYPSDDILTLARANGVELEIRPIAKEGFVFFVNSNNPVDSLEVSDIQKIYAGQVTNWAQIGGENANILSFQRVDNSTAQREMMTSVMKNLSMIDSPKDIFTEKNYGRITDLIARYDNSKNAIGYGYYYETKMLYDIDAKYDNAIKILKINGIEPNYETIHNGTYPITTNYYLIKVKDNTSETIQIFIDTIFSERGNSIIKEAGYIDN